MEKWSSEGVVLLGGFVTIGPFSESSESICGGGLLHGDSLLYRVSNSPSEVPSLLHISSCVSTSWRRSCLFKHLILSFLYDRFLADGLVNIFDNSLFGFLPKCASNGATFVVLLGLRRMFSITFAILELKVSELHMGWMSNTAKRRFNVCISLSTIPVPLLSPAGASINLKFLFLQNTSNSFALNACAWSQRIERGIPCILQWHSK